MNLNDNLLYTDALVALGEIIAQQREIRDSYRNANWDTFYRLKSEVAVLEQAYANLSKEDIVHAYVREAQVREDALGDALREFTEPDPNDLVGGDPTAMDDQADNS